MAWIWSKMRLRGTSRTQSGQKESLGYLDGGFGLVARRLAEEIAKLGGGGHTAEPVRRLTPLSQEAASERFEIETSRRTERFDAVVSTVAPPLLAKIAPELPDRFR